MQTVEKYEKTITRERSVPSKWCRRPTFYDDRLCCEDCTKRELAFLGLPDLRGRVAYLQVGTDIGDLENGPRLSIEWWPVWVVDFDRGRWVGYQIDVYGPPDVDILSLADTLATYRPEELHAFEEIPMIEAPTVDGNEIRWETPEDRTHPIWGLI